MAALYANKVFFAKDPKYKEAAKYFIMSGLRFEDVCLKYINANKMSELNYYLHLVLAKLKRLSGMDEDDE